MLRKKPEREQDVFLQIMVEPVLDFIQKHGYLGNQCTKVYHKREHKVFSFENIFIEVVQITQEAGSVAKLWFFSEVDQCLIHFTDEIT